MLFCGTVCCLHSATFRELSDALAISSSALFSFRIRRLPWCDDEEVGVSILEKMDEAVEMKDWERVS